MKAKILIVDDEQGICDFLKVFLEGKGYKVFAAGEGNAALSIIGKENPHLIILDVVLCGQTGFELCEWIKDTPETKDIIVILFTALNQEHDYKEGKRVKCDYYLTKPQNPKDIVKKVKEYLDVIKGEKK